MTSNNLSKEEQILKGQGTVQKGDWAELRIHSCRAF